jgi:hypothetical protein
MTTSHQSSLRLPSYLQAHARCARIFLPPSPGFVFVPLSMNSSHLCRCDISSAAESCHFMLLLGLSKRITSLQSFEISKPKIYFLDILKDLCLAWLTMHSIFFALLARFRNRFHLSVSRRPFLCLVHVPHITGSSAAIILAVVQMVSPHSPIRRARCICLPSRAIIPC